MTVTDEHILNDAISGVLAVGTVVRPIATNGCILESKHLTNVIEGIFRTYVYRIPNSPISTPFAYYEFMTPIKGHRGFLTTWNSVIYHSSPSMSIQLNDHSPMSNPNFGAHSS